MSDRLDVIARDREAAHRACLQAYALAQALLADDKPVRISAGEDEDPLTVKQRRFYHGPVLTQISEQVRVDGERYVAAIWKEYFRKLFLGQGGYRYVVKKVPRWDRTLRRLVQPKRATPHAERISTEDLSIKQYSELIDKVIAHAATELGVEFHFIDFEREEVRWNPTPRKQRQPEAAQAA